ncbi:iron-containing alcohol dehydrogenase [Zongyangia hominis]|uniref:Iron-containing alcohol dehydrogenase n=1 Tax=Zongyangia hominis TaxID=2763677 RepID=A0A926E7P7_9FIRM|nr:iron-containing alcohol dehydrogenase [Zongyangia hominis]MBC8569375.1 iron-containing alcohol dehydrogenase [Zongyangia hominis]
MQSFSYYIPVRLFFGKGELNRMATEKLPGKKAIIVTSGGTSMKKYGYLDRLTALLEKNNTAYVIFDKILPNPIKSHVMEGAALAKAEGCDFVIGLGGGSSIDSSKAIAVMATNEGDYWDYISGGSGKGQPIVNDPLPIIAITTTAGTGTEADPFTVTTKEETDEKIGFGCDKTFPYFSIIDPDLMMSVPPKLTAYQGFDALFHSTEGYIANIANPISDLFALKAIELIGKYLPQAVKDGSDAEARANVALANTLAGMVESTSSCTSEHSIEHAMSGYHPELPHGAGLIMVSLAYNSLFAQKVPERFVDMAKALGKTDAKEPMDFVTALHDLQKACGVDQLKMSDYGIKKEELDKIATHAKNIMGGLFDLDRYQMTHEDIVDVLEKSYR